DTGDISLSRSTFQNLGSFTIQNGATLFGDDISSFQNLNGLVTKTTGGVTIFDIAFAQSGILLLNGNDIRLNQGTTQTGDGSRTDLGGGTLDVQGIGFTLDGGLFQGPGTRQGDLTTHGVVEVGLPQGNAGTLTISGGYTPSAGATLRLLFGSQT